MRIWGMCLMTDRRRPGCATASIPHRLMSSSFPELPADAALLRWVTDQSGLARDAHPRSVFLHPRIRESSASRDRFTLQDAFFMIDAGYDRARAVDLDTCSFVCNLVRIQTRSFDAGKKLRLIHERAIVIGIGQCAGEKLVQRADVLVLLGYIPSSFEGQNQRLIRAKVVALLRGQQE